jgi:hypothetical protein
MLESTKINTWNLATDYVASVAYVCAVIQTKETAVPAGFILTEMASQFLVGAL